MSKPRRKRISTSEAVALFMVTPWMQNAFWSRVRLLPGCWEWRGITKRGYGRFAVDRTQVYAHRLSYAYWHGVDPGDGLVCHDCDNPPCTNPQHLFLGTHADNNADRVRRGRNGSTKGLTFIRGEEMGSAKLREPTIIEIRTLHAAGVQQKELAQAYGVAPNTISQIVNRRTWAHVQQPPKEGE